MKWKVFSMMVVPAVLLTLETASLWAVEVTVKVTGSSGAGVEGVVIAYGSGSNPSAAYFGPAPHKTNAAGEITGDLVDGTYSFEARYHNGKAQLLELAISGTSVTVPLETYELTLRLEECDTGDPINGGYPRYGAGDVYATTWFPDGSQMATGSSAPGEVTGELFPGEYSFEMQYAGGAEVKSLTMPEEDALLRWKASNVTLQYSGRISYGGPEGNARWFKPDPIPAVASNYMLPGVYTFHARTNGADDLTGLFDLNVSGCSVTKSIIILKLIDQSGDPLAGGKAKECRGWFGGRNVRGETDSEYGAIVELLNGLRTQMCYEMSVNCGYAKKTQDVSTDSIIVFQTQPVTLRLQKCPLCQNE